MQLRDAVKDEFLDTYAKMACLEAVVERFDHLQAAKGPFAQPESHSAFDSNQDNDEMKVAKEERLFDEFKNISRNKYAIGKEILGLEI